MIEERTNSPTFDMQYRGNVSSTDMTTNAYIQFIIRCFRVDCLDQSILIVTGPFSLIRAVFSSEASVAALETSPLAEDCRDERMASAVVDGEGRTHRGRLSPSFPLWLCRAPEVVPRRSLAASSSPCARTSAFAVGRCLNNPQEDTVRTTAVPRKRGGTRCDQVNGSSLSAGNVSST